MRVGRATDGWNWCAGSDETEGTLLLWAHKFDSNTYQCVQYTPMTSSDLIREMQRAGWQLDRVNGSHHIYKHPMRPGIVVVPHPKKDLGLGLVKAIRRQAGI